MLKLKSVTPMNTKDYSYLAFSDEYNWWDVMAGTAPVKEQYYDGVFSQYVMQDDEGGCEVRYGWSPNDYYSDEVIVQVPARYCHNNRMYLYYDPKTHTILHRCTECEHIETEGQYDYDFLKSLISETEE